LVAEHSNRNKYSDDEPRDETGKWTAGGGADMASPSDWAGNSIKPDGSVDFDAAMKGYSIAHYGTDVRHMVGCKPDEGLSALTKLGDLQRQFPGIKIASMGMTDGQWGQGTIAQAAPGAKAGTSVIELNPEYWTNDEMNLRSLYGQDNGFHPNGTSTPSGYITHEFGHAVANKLFGLSASLDEGDKPVGDRFRTWIKSDFTPSVPVSGYAEKDDNEKFAELFSGATTKGSGVYDTQIAQSMRSMLKDTGVWKG
jgi:hypothetical protein